MNEKMNECLKKKTAPLGIFMQKIPNADILWIMCAWSCTATLTLSTINLTQRDSINSQSIDQLISQSVIQSFGHLSFHITDDTNALLHSMKWTSVSVCSSSILSHIRYVSGLMSENTYFQQKIKLYAQACQVYLLMKYSACILKT